jgi:NitT/TauT family transport system substrate-binding protein
MNTARHVGTALCLTVAMALAPWGIEEAKAQTQDITVILPNPSAINVFPLHVAIGEGYFEEEGLNVRVEAVDGSSQVLQAMAAGQAQIGLPGPGPVLAARSRGEDVVFIYTGLLQIQNNLRGLRRHIKETIDTVGPQQSANTISVPQRITH